MKFFRILFSLSIVIALTISLDVYAHPGRTDSSGCHTCRTNCENWGLSYGEYHCHNGSSSNSTRSSSGSNSSSNSSNFSNNTTPVITQTKSSNTKLESLKINDEEISIKNTMTYSTRAESVFIKAQTEDVNADVTYDSFVKLKTGNNNLKIKVTAEDGTTKTYSLIIKKLESNDTSLAQIIINGETLESPYDKELNYTLYEGNINIKVIPNDDKAQVYYEESPTLKEGINKITIKVVAEDGSEETYTINIDKIAQLGAVEIIISLIIIGVPIFLIIYFVIRQNKRKANDKTKCIHCNRLISKGSRYCPKCGKSQTNNH